MNSGTKRSENYCLTTDNQRQILVQFFNDGMRSTLDTEKISEASKVAGLSVQRVKVIYDYENIGIGFSNSIPKDIVNENVNNE